MKRGIHFLLAAVVCGFLVVLFLAKNYGHGNDERLSRALWARQNGKMLDFVRDHMPSGARVYQLVDDPECSDTFRFYIADVCRKECRGWVSMPIHVTREGGYKVHSRTPAEMRSLLQQARSGDMLLVPVTRANVSYIRMPLFNRASGLFPGIVPPALQQRLRCIYSEYEQFKHASIPPHVESYLVANKRIDVLGSLRTSGLQLGFGWQVYQVQ